jgi:hypothetical protein
VSFRLQMSNTCTQSPPFRLPWFLETHNKHTKSLTLSHAIPSVKAPLSALQQDGEFQN